MNRTQDERFRRILEAARRRDGGGGIDTMIVNSHLSQMKLFMLRQGVEFYPEQDTFGFRKTFLEGLIEENEIDCRLEGIVDDFLIDGKGLFYFRPIGDSYRLMWFNKEHYRAYYDSDGALSEVDLIYSFEVRDGLGVLQVPGKSGNSERWVKLVVKRDTIQESILNERPTFDNQTTGAMHLSRNTRTLTNSLGFIPAIEAFNNLYPTGMDAAGEFDWLAEQIVAHDDLVKNIRTNIHFFGNPTLVSSRPRHDLVESSGSESLRPTISSQAGFYGGGRPSTRVSQPTGAGGGAGGMKIPRIIANIEPTDRATFLTPDAVSGDQNLYARQYREELRTALGGVDELGITSGATAYEIKSLFGRAATTANRKCRGLLTYGLCKLFALIIFHEETIFRKSFAAAIGLPEPVAPIQENFPDPEQFQMAMDEFQGLVREFKANLDAAIKQAVDEQNMPPGVVGLIPDGSRKISWRWKGPVFEDSTEDILNTSIVVRNLQELGVNSIEALHYLFPDKTDEERGAMLSGYPFRMAQATQQSIGTFLSLIGTMGSVPHPQAPDLPLLADPKLDLTPYIYRAFDFLKRELTYAGSYADSSESPEPTSLNPVERARADAGLPTSAGPERPTFIPDSFGASAPGPGSPGAGQPMAGGVQQAGRQSERDAILPAAGTLLAADPTGGGINGAGSLGFGGADVRGGAIRFGAPDLSAPTNAGLYPGDAATGAELQQRADAAAAGPERKRRVSRKRQQRKS